MQQYKYTGVLVYAYDENNLMHFLLGREAIIPDWPASGKFSDFGGNPSDETEDKLNAAIRECFEETMGILGCEETLREKITLSPSITIDNSIIIYLLHVDYDHNLPVYYNRIYNYLTKCATYHPKIKDFKYIPSCPEGYYEKIELKWVSINEIRQTLESNDKDSPYRASFLKSINIILQSWSELIII